jgi:hypothetical protein
MITKFATFSFCSLLLILAGAAVRAQQVADPHFNARVEEPAYTKNFPRVLFDEAHYNFHTAAGRYKPFADLIFSDGYQVVVNRKPFTKESLRMFKILVIANALGAEDMDEDGADHAAFTEEEADEVRDWVRGGGSLLFIANHGPFAAAAEGLAKRLGVNMSKGSSVDQAHSVTDSNNPAFIVYSRRNHLLGEHPITKGRNDNERIDRVITFTGQSLKGPPESEAFLKLADTAVDMVPPDNKEVSAAGRAQGIAFRLGKGRVVVLGEAGMLTAQLDGRDNKPFGMNVPGTDNKQLALNIMHWLSGILK